MRSLTIVQANWWRENPRPKADLKLITSLVPRPHIVGINEGANYTDLFATADGYQLIVGDQDRAERNNPILLRDDLEYLGAGTRTMCAKVGISPERTATYVLFLYGGQKRAHVSTHANSHVEKSGEPRNLPRVGQYVEHMRNLQALLRELRQSGYATTLTADLNWAWTKAPAVWRWAPKNVLRRAGYAIQWDHRTAPAYKRRRIDYQAYDPDDLAPVSQRLVPGEHSDHPWPEVTYAIKESL